MESRKPKAFKNQNIEDIRSNVKNYFKDPYFKPKIESIMAYDNNAPKDELKQLKEFKENLDKLLFLNKDSIIQDFIIWQRPSVRIIRPFDKYVIFKSSNYKNIVGSLNCMFSHKNPVKQMFVLSDKPIDKNSINEYLNLFKTTDSFQGYIGNCYLIAAIINLTCNKKFLEWFIPIDNAFEENMEKGAYHFRFWNYGEWCDVVIDDFLPTTKSNHLLFCHNDKNRNVFWPSLVEKAFAKYIGSYAYMSMGGITTDVLLLLTGGIPDFYYIDVLKCENDAFTITITYQYKDKFLKSFELYQIINIALNLCYPIGVAIIPGENNAEPLKYSGLVQLHAYLVTDCKQIDNKYFLKIQNPYNVDENYKESFDYNEINELIKKKKLEETKGGEFWINYDDFLLYFTQITVFNLFPEEIPDLNKALGITDDMSADDVKKKLDGVKGLGDLTYDTNEFYGYTSTQTVRIFKTPCKENPCKLKIDIEYLNKETLTNEESEDYVLRVFSNSGKVIEEKKK